MVDRRIMTTSGVESVLKGTVIDKLASELRVILLQSTTQFTMPCEKSGTVWWTSGPR
jgi:hypothetical protein